MDAAIAIYSGGPTPVLTSSATSVSGRRIFLDSPLGLPERPAVADDEAA